MLTVLASDELRNGQVATSSHHPDGTREGRNALWSCSAPPKVMSFAWRLANNSIATWCNKTKCKLETSLICPICGADDEDSFHMFCTCTNARVLWQAIATEWTLPDVTMIKPTGLDWFVQLICDIDEPTQVKLLMLLWRIRHVRNELVH